MRLCATICSTRSVRLVVAASTVGFLAVTATRFALRSEAAPPPPVVQLSSDEAVDADDAPRFAAANWWQEGASCPPDARLHGGPPPDGFEVWCARQDGQRHGLHLGWHRNGRQAFVREYRDGVASGMAIDWWSSGQQARAGRYADGIRQGQWRRWHADGQLAEVLDYDSSGQLVVE